MDRDYKRFCTNIEAVINYEKAKADDFKGWELHHILETHTSDWICRPHNARLTRDELIAMNMYFHRPPTEFIFLTRFEHNSLHWKGKKFSKERRQRISESLKGNQRALGNHFSHSEDAKKRISEGQKGKHWYNNGETNVFTYECPNGFVPGVIKRRKK